MTTCALASCTAAEVQAGINAKIDGNYPTNLDIDSFWLLTNAMFGELTSEINVTAVALFSHP